MKERPAGGAGDLSIDQEVVAAAAAPTEGRSRAWLAILLFGAAATAAYYLPILDAYGRAIGYVGIDCLMVAAVVLGIRLNRPARPLAWALFGLGMAAMALGDIAWYWYSLVQKVTPTSSFADLFYLAEYPMLIAGMGLMVRNRPDLAAALDTLMITTGAAVAVFEFIVRPNLETFSGSASDLIVTVAYPIADVGLLALLVRIGLSGNLGRPAVRLLVAGMIAFFMADIVNLWVSLAGKVPDPSPMDAAWLMSMVLWAAAVAHPSARVELNSDGTDWVRRRLSRRLLLAAALLILPATMFAEDVAGTTAYLPVLLAGWTVIVALVILRVEAALSLARQSEERFRIIFEDSPAGMTIARSGRIILANRTVRSMFGVGASDPPSADIADFVSPDRARQVGDVVAARARGEMLSEPFETIGRRADGTVFPLAVSPRTIDLPDGRATIAFLCDLTAQRAAEEALRASERRYRDLFESSPHPMWIYDSETLRFLAVNDTAVRRYGWSVDEFKAMTIADICPPEELPELVAGLRSDKAGRPPTTSTRHVRADGSIIQVEVTTHSLTWDGRPAQVVLAEDVTERMRLEEQFRQAQKMEAIGRLAGGIAHDFNNLLTAVSGYGHLLRGEFEPGDPRLAEVDEILLASDRAASLTRQLLAFSRRLVLMPRAIDLNESVAELRGMLTRLIGEDLHLKFVPGENLGRVRADPGQLTQVLMNLAVNARDAMPKGGTLTIETRNVMLDAAFVATHEGIKAGPHVMLRVGDTGTGMDASILSHLFEPFFTTKEVGKGTGLGLATVYGIVRASEGTIDVSSEVGRGSTFDIFLPLAPGDTVPSAGPSPVEPVPRGHETILVVEDEASVRKLVVSVLERQGYAVLSADGPEPAESIALEHPGPIELLLTDVVMPGGNGAELAARIRQMRPAVKVILMTGYAQESIAHHGALNEGIILVQKPFSPNLLLTRVRMALDSEPPSS